MYTMLQHFSNQYRSFYIIMLYHLCHKKNIICHCSFIWAISIGRFNYLFLYLHAELKNLLKFTTGACSTNSGYIDVDVCTQTDSIYASTCLCELVLPDSLAMIPFEEFKLVIQAALSFQTFNCV